jgi:hypothetical protein
MPTGYRSSRRGSKSAHKSKRAMKTAKIRNGADSVFGRTARTVRAVLYLIAWAAVAVVGAALVFVIIANGVNSIARWQAQQAADVAASPDVQEEKARDNLLIIGSSEGVAQGFLAVRVEPDNEQVFGIAIPDAAFIEVPGQGFERVGDSFAAGADVSMAAVSNFLGVQFSQYISVSQEVYQGALETQSLAGVMNAVLDTNLKESEQTDFAERLDAISTSKVALVPLPVKPITLGAQTYFEPQRELVADLLQSWWGVTMGSDSDIIRVIVYNGSGEPGVAGEAAQLMIRSGYRVVDTKNADNFDYEITQIVVQNDIPGTGEGVLDVLGTGTIVEQRTDQQVADVIVILGADFTALTSQ